MDKRYQVFVSSTFRDLQEERQEVMHALLELDCIPSGMELFPAADESQWELIKRVIDDCDYYVLIIGGRYGDVDGEGLGYTEKEYRYALQIGKPIIAFIHKNRDSLPFDRSEQSEEKRTKLLEFIGLVEERHCKYWQGAKDLGSIVSRSLVKLMKTRPAVGWVRANDVAISDSLTNVKDDQHRVTALGPEQAIAKQCISISSSELACGDEAFRLRVDVTLESIYGGRGDEREELIELTWNEIFAQVAPVIEKGESEYKIHQALTRLVERKVESKYRRKRPDANPGVKAVYCEPDDMQTIIIQFRALGLIQQPTKTQALQTGVSGWRLTKRGEELMLSLRTVKVSGADSKE